MHAAHRRPLKPVFRTLANDVLAFYDEIRSKKK
jgi:hypothetical protein